MQAGRCQPVAGGGQTSVPWGLSRSVIDSVGPGGRRGRAYRRFGVRLAVFIVRARGIPIDELLDTRLVVLALTIEGVFMSTRGCLLWPCT
jgi:hypothetical protein